MKIVNPTAVLGENLATEYLQKKGYTIVERNFRKGYGEIDIIATCEDSQDTQVSTLLQNSPQPSLKKRGSSSILVFVEVKTRRSAAYGSPLEAITRWKLKELVQTARFYKHIHPSLPDSMRIDAISVILNPDNKNSIIEHVENISM